MGESAWHDGLKEYVVNTTWDPAVGGLQLFAEAVGLQARRRSHAMRPHPHARPTPPTPGTTSRAAAPVAPADWLGRAHSCRRRRRAQLQSACPPLVQAAQVTRVVGWGRCRLCASRGAAGCRGWAGAGRRGKGHAHRLGTQRGLQGCRAGPGRHTQPASAARACQGHASPRFQCADANACKGRRVLPTGAAPAGSPQRLLSSLALLLLLAPALPLPTALLPRLQPDCRHHPLMHLPPLPHPVRPPRALMVAGSILGIVWLALGFVISGGCPAGGMPASSGNLARGWRARDS